MALACDFCGKSMTPKEKVVFVPKDKMRAAVDKGFNLHKAKYIDTSLLKAANTAFLNTVNSIRDKVPKSQLNQLFEKQCFEWELLVRSDNSDWGLCIKCAEGFNREIAEFNTTKINNKKNNFSKHRKNSANGIRGSKASAKIVFSNDQVRSIAKASRMIREQLENSDQGNSATDGTKKSFQMLAILFFVLLLLLVLWLKNL